MTATEIARIIGGTTAPRVRSMLYAHGIPLLQDRGHTDILQVRWKRTDRDLLDQVADRSDRDPAELAALLIRKALAEKGLAERLVHPMDVVGL